MNRAYSILDIKSVDEEKRVITGMATTPNPDRVGDIVEPLGAEYAAEIPALWQHNHWAPVGVAKLGKATAKGIPFTIELSKTDEPGTLKDRLDEAWQSVKLKLVRAVSIGFRALEYAYMDTGGVRFSKVEIMELSLVTIPANSDCTIQTIKQYDAEALAASGHRSNGANPPGDTGTKPVRVTINPETKAVRKGGLFDFRPKEGKMTLSEEIATCEENIKQKTLRMQEIRKATNGSTMDEAESEEYKTLGREAQSLKNHVALLKMEEDLVSTTAKPIGEVKSVETGSAARSSVEVKRQPRLEPGIGFARLAKAKAVGFKTHEPAHVVAERMYGADSETVAILKAAVVPGANTSGNWAADLVGAETSAYSDFATYLRPYTILGKFGQNGIPSLRSVPFRSPLITQTGGGAGYWTGEGKPKPLTAFDFDRTTLEPLKVANICVLTMESVRDSSPSSDAIVRDSLRDALSARLDIDFINPAKAASSGVSPASITNGVSAPNSAGTDADAVREDIQTLLTAFITANNPPSTGVIIMKTTTALVISLMRNALGQKEFPDITMNGGMLEGFPVITSEYVPSVTAGTYMFMVNAQDIFIGDEGGFSIDVSTEASLEMLDGSLTQDGLAGTGASLVSMFQNNLIAIRAERTINWKKRRASAVAAIDTIAYAL